MTINCLISEILESKKSNVNITKFVFGQCGLKFDTETLTKHRMKT